MNVNIWIAMSQQALDEFRDYRQQGDAYVGPMGADTFDTLRRMVDTDNVQRLFNNVVADGKVYTLFSLYLSASAEAKTRIDHIATQWPDNFIVVGAWNWDGSQVEIAGEVAYPVHAQAWKLMPDIVEYETIGEFPDFITVESGRTPAASNVDLRDINLLQGQEPRDFAA